MDKGLENTINSWNTKLESRKINPKQIKLSEHHILVFSDFHWDHFPKRPQKLSLNLAGSYNIIYVEYLPSANSSPQTKITQILPSLLVLSITASNIDAFYSQLMKMTDDGTTSSIAYIFSLTFSEISSFILFRKVIYDCMKDACPLKDGGMGLIKMERKLLKHTYAVVASNRLLFEAKLHHHHNVHYLPASTYSDETFHQVNHPHMATTLPAIKGPCIGYAGIIDERIDFILIRQTAELKPELNFILIGPVTVDLDRTQFPSNVYFPGKYEPEYLYFYLEKFDIYMVPFVTCTKMKHLCPSKILDYMKAKKNILCTNVLGIVREFPLSLTFISDASDFSSQATAIIRKKSAPNLEMYRYHLENRRWQCTLSKYRQILK